MSNVRVDEADERVRPIPVDIDPDDVPPMPPSQSSTVARHWRRIGAVLVFAGILAVGALGTLGERSGTSSDDEASGPHLGDDAQLVLAARADSDGWSIVWTPRPGSQPTGAIGAIPSPTSRGAMAPAADASGEWIATTVCTGSTCELAIALRRDPSVIFASLPAPDHSWHAEAPARLAWIETRDDRAVLRTGAISGDLELTTEPVTIAVPSDSRLVWWDDAGFVIEGTTVTALDGTGSPTWSADGVVLMATATTVVVQHDNGSWSMIDRMDGHRIAGGGDGSATFVVAQAFTSEPTTTSTEFEARYTFEVVAATAGDQPQEFVALPINRDVGTEYRLLRNAVGDVFTVHVMPPTPEQ